MDKKICARKAPPQACPGATSKCHPIMHDVSKADLDTVCGRALQIRIYTNLDGLLLACDTVQPAVWIELVCILAPQLFIAAGSQS